MKKTFLTLLCFTSIFILTAQSGNKKTTFGIKAGFVMSNIDIGSNLYSSSSYNAETTDFLPSVTVGGFANYRFSKIFSLQPELLYSGMGYGASNYDARQGYLLLPIYSKLSFGRYEGRGFSFMAGPQIGYLISSKIKNSQYDVEGNYVEGGTSFDSKEFYHKLDISLSAGLSYKFKIGLEVYNRFALSLNSVLKHDYFNTDGRNISFTLIGLGYSF